MNKKIKTINQNFFLSDKAFVSIMLGLVLIVMIPISDIAYSKPPKFDPSPQGKHCSSLYDVIQSLLAKQSQLKSQGSDLSASDQATLAQANDEYMTDCKDKYGYPTRAVNPKGGDLSAIDEDMVLEQTDQPQSPKHGLPSNVNQDDMAVLDDSVQQTTQPLSADSALTENTMKEGQASH